MKKVLMIAYHFPPIAGGGVFRTLKFTKYLPDFNWQPIVLSVKKSKFSQVDETLLGEIPDAAKVHRTNTVESKIHRWGASFIGINPKWYQIPDAFLGWLPFALLKAKQIIKKEKPDVIYSTSPTVISHLVAMMLKKETDLPWVADFRDPWTQNFNINYPTKIHKKIDGYLEHKVAKYADEIISVTEPIKIDFIKQYKDILPEKCIVITNGYDSDDFKNIKIKKSDKFTISHIGSFYGNVSPAFFLEGVKNAIKERKSLEKDIEILFIGRASKENWGIANEYELGEVVREIGYSSHEKAIQYMTDSTCLLLIIGLGKKSRLLFSGKIFEYIASGTSIIATVPTDGVAANLIRETNTGTVVNTDDVDGIKNAILDFHDKWKEGKLKIEPDWDIIEKYSRKELTKKLANVFDDVSEPEK